MSRIPLSEVGATPFERLMGWSSDILKSWSQLEQVFFQSQHFTPEFLEQVRRALAFDNLCQYCMAKAGPADYKSNDEKLVRALRFANQFAIDHKLVTDSDIEELKHCFTVAEISELVSFCSFISASQRFGAVLGLQAAHQYSSDPLII